VPHTLTPSHGSPHPSKKFKTAPDSGSQNKLIRDAPFPESSFICLSKVLINEPPPGSPMGAHMEKIVHFHSLLLHVPQIPE